MTYLENKGNCHLSVILLFLLAKARWTTKTYSPLLGTSLISTRREGLSCQCRQHFSLQGVVPPDPLQRCTLNLSSWVLPGACPMLRAQVFSGRRHLSRSCRIGVLKCLMWCITSMGCVYASDSDNSSTYHLACSLSQLLLGMLSHVAPLLVSVIISFRIEI